MKQVLLTAFGLFTALLTLTAQITVRQADFTLSSTAKDSAISKLMRKTGAILPTGGNNQTWDYSNLRDSIADLYYTGGIYTPATTPRPTAFATATTQYFYVTSFQAFSIPGNTYFRTDATGHHFLGDSIFATRYSLQTITGSSTDSLTFPAQVRACSTPWPWHSFPVTANSVTKSNFRQTTNFLLKVGLLGLNNTPGQSVNIRSVVDTVMGWGTLKLRHPSTGATLNFNTLLIRQTDVATDSFFLGGAPAPPQVLSAFGLTQGSRSTRTYYNFLGANFKANYLSFELATNSSTNISNVFRGILPNLGLTVKNSELVDLNVQTTVFPNPTTEGVTFEFDKKSEGTWRVFVYNEAGQIVSNDNVSAPIGATQHRLSFAKGQANGVYFYQIIDDNALIRNTGKVLLNR